MPGIDANFCSPVKENLLCGLCGLPLRKPVQISSCGHRFCESCLDNAFEPLRGGEQELLRCPADQLEVKQSQVYSDESSGKKIQSLTVLCRHCSQGCKWKGQLRKLKSHLTSCDFGVIECSNKCGVQLMRSQLAEHVRNLCSNRHVSCATCHQDIPREDYEKHSRSCGKDDSSAASKLRKQIKNISRSRHESASFNSSSSRGEQQPPMRAASVPAQLNFVGRIDVPRRTAEEWHGTTGRRRSRRSRHLVEHDDVIEETVQEEQVAEVANNVHDSLSRVQSAPLRQRSDYGSQVVYVGSSENPPHTDPRELFTCVCGALMANEEITTHMSEECPKRLTLCQYCRKQVGHAELQEHLRDCTRFPLSCPNSCGVRQIPREEMNCHVTNDCSAILETCPFKFAGCQHKCPRSNINRHMEHKMKEHLNLMCKLTVKQSKQISELQGVVKHCKPFNQAQLLWKIEKFSSVLETAKEVTGYEVHSPPFFTDQYGYKFMIVAFPNGNGSGEGTHLSLYVRLLVGEYDSLLKWPFLGDITLTLIDQSQDTTKQRHISQNFSPDPKWTSFHRPKMTNNTPGFGYPQFASHETLRARQYLVDDALFIRATVELPQIIEA